MTITLTEQTTTTEVAEVAPVVAGAYLTWVAVLEGKYPKWPVAEAHAALLRIAEGEDQPLCVVWGRLCCTPHDLTERSCCQTWVCGDHEDEHDKHCTEFIAQLLEEAL